MDARLGMYNLVGNLNFWILGVVLLSVHLKVQVLHAQSTLASKNWLVLNGPCWLDSVRGFFLEGRITRYSNKMFFYFLLYQKMLIVK